VAETTMLDPDTIRQNRIKAVAALRAADESKRLQSIAYESSTGKMCACAVISQALGIWSPSQIFTYEAFEEALGESAEGTWALNDKVEQPENPMDPWLDEPPGPPLYTFAEIGDIKARDWHLE
jgi:hypothetical protein